MASLLPPDTSKARASIDAPNLVPEPGFADVRYRSTLVLVSLWLTVMGCQPAQHADPRPNILLISLDTLRADHLGCYGYERPTSPFLDEVAAGGILYENAFVNTHGTPPSHATIFSSLYQETHEVNQKRPIPENVVLLPELLNEAGYLTIGVTGGGFMSANFGFDRGFEVFDSSGSAIHTASKDLLDLLRRHGDDPRPTFAFFHTYQVHSPYLPPKRYREIYGQFESDIEPTNEVLLPIKETAHEHLTPADIEYLLAMYDGEIRHTDDVLRKMFGQLEEIGFFDNYVVVITSDHGEEFAEHGGLLHGITLYEELLKVPLILAGSNLAGATVDDRLVSSVDIAPTILARAGVPVPETMAGSDLLGERPDVAEDRPAVFSQFQDILYGIRTPRWKLIWDTRERSLSLFDLEKDPAELHDVAEDHPERVRRLQRRLRSWRRDTLQLESTDSTEVEMSQEQLERLEALGYIN